MSRHSLSARNIVKQFPSKSGSFVAVNDLSFDLKPGESVAFLGPNGAGKSTTIKILCGILSPTSGQAEINGLPAGTLLANRELGLVFGTRSQLYMHMTVRQCLDLIGEIYFGDILQGLCSLVALFFIATPAMAGRCMLFTLVSAAGCMSLFILTGSIPFFVQRGNSLGLLLRECCLSLSFYPMGKVFRSPGRYLLFLTPAAVTGLLPMDAIDNGSWESAFIAVAASATSLWMSIRIFELGLRRYQGANYVAART